MFSSWSSQRLLQSGDLSRTSFYRKHVLSEFETMKLKQRNNHFVVLCKTKGRPIIVRSFIHFN